MRQRCDIYKSLKATTKVQGKLPRSLRQEYKSLNGKHRSMSMKVRTRRKQSSEERTETPGNSRLGSAEF